MEKVTKKHPNLKIGIMFSLLFIYMHLPSISGIVSHTKFLLQFCSVEGLLWVSHAKGQMMEASTSYPFTVI